jgi:hypothetical protein
MKTMIKFAAVTFLALTGSALAGKGGSAGLIQQAVSSGSVDAIIAEVERTEGLMCEDCVQMVTNLTTDNRYAVREVAGWWFAKRPALRDMLATQFEADLTGSDSVRVRNAADFLGSTVTLTALPQLRTAMTHSGLSVDAKLAIVRAAKALAHTSGNPILVTAMGDANASVRAAALGAWRDVLNQKGAAPAVALLGDTDANVRAQAAALVGGMGELTAVPKLESMVTDSDAFVRRNAAWALGKLGQQSSRTALTIASKDGSGLVSMTAKVALTQLH